MNKIDILSHFASIKKVKPKHSFFKNPEHSRQYLECSSVIKRKNVHIAKELVT